uniref:Uncharacterized protein n=1 Tax=Arundo donax TaxID=35708 RepID=A0A0A9ED97_ARUDO
MPLPPPGLANLPQSGHSLDSMSSSMESFPLPPSPKSFSYVPLCPAQGHGAVWSVVVLLRRGRRWRYCAEGLRNGGMPRRAAASHEGEIWRATTRARRVHDALEMPRGCHLSRPNGCPRTMLQSATLMAAELRWR